MNNLANVIAERYLIGAMLIHNDSIETVSSIVHPNDMTDQICRDLFFLIMAVRARGEAVDIISLSATREALSAGQSTISEAASIQREVYSYTNILPMAEKVRRLAQLRAYRMVLDNALQEIDQESLVDDLVGNTQNNLTHVIDRSKASDVVKVSETMPRLIADITERMDAGGKVSGLLSGYQDLDNLIAGMRGGHMVVIAGRPGTGKTTLAMNIAEHQGIAGTSSLVFSLEMSSLELTRRMLSSLGRVPLNAIDTGMIGDYSENITLGAHKIKDMPIWVCDKGGLGISQIRSIARFQRRMNKIGMIVIDYIGLIRTAGVKGSTRSQELGEISRQCKEMAKELNIPVIVLAQLNREIDKTDRDPRLSDLRDSGEIEQDADVVAFVCKTQDEGVSKVVVAKHRHSKTGECRLLHRGELSRFDTLAAGFTPKQPRTSAREF